MESGKLRHKITILQAEEGRNPYGEMITVYQDVKPVYAQLITQYSERDTLAEGEQVVTYAKFKIRFIRWLDLSYGISFQGQIYRIQHLLNVKGKGRELIIEAESYGQPRNEP